MMSHKFTVTATFDVKAKTARILNVFPLYRLSQSGAPIFISNFKWLQRFLSIGGNLIKKHMRSLGDIAKIPAGKLILLVISSI